MLLPSLNQHGDDVDVSTNGRIEIISLCLPSISYQAVPVSVHGVIILCMVLTKSVC